METTQRDEVVQLAVRMGIDADLFDRWDGCELALYRDRGGRSADLEVAKRIAREKAERKEWILDLGHRAFALSAQQGAALQYEFDQQGIRYETGAQAQAYLKRTRWAANEHKAVLDELAKR